MRNERPQGHGALAEPGAELQVYSLPRAESPEGLG